MTLFRLVNPSEGSVRIDGIDTAVLNLTELRRRIAIIPQVRARLVGCHSWVGGKSRCAASSPMLRRNL